jgi:putative SOS response-associated peptidase YedK
MCGRFNQTASAKKLKSEFGIKAFKCEEGEILPRYNIAPSQDVLVVRADLPRHERSASLMHWGLIPHWASDKRIAYKTINARAETVADKPSYRDAFKNRRCLIPATGFYEWQKLAQGKQPYHIRMQNAEPFAMAGLWEHWQDEDSGEEIESCTIIVTDANKLMSKIHARMPVILPATAWNTWLNPDFYERKTLQSLLRPYPAEEMDLYPISKEVNNPANDYSTLLTPH